MASQELTRRPQIPRAFPKEHRRRRYVDATAELLHEFARHELSVALIAQLAGTSRDSFYDVFTGAKECIAHGLGLAEEVLFARLEVQDGKGAWLTEMHDSIAGFYAAVAAEPILAELLLVHSAASQAERGRAATGVGSERFERILGRGRADAEARGCPPPPRLADEYLSRAIVSLAAERVRGPEVGALPEESRAMAALVGSYYVGFEAAEEILGGPAHRLLQC